MVSPKLMRTVQHFHIVGRYFSRFRIKLFGCPRSVYTSATLDSANYQSSTYVSQVLSNLVCFSRRAFYFLLKSIPILLTVEQPRELLRCHRYTYQIQTTSEMKNFQTSTSSTSLQQDSGILRRSRSWPKSSGSLLRPPCIAIQCYAFTPSLSQYTTLK